MPEYYFEKFPIIEYQNTACRDLTKRVQVNPSIRPNMDLYNPVEIEAGFRPDELAEAYYEEPELEWSIYLFNDIVDPYYEWYLSLEDFNDFLDVKYGDPNLAPGIGVANSQEHIAYYRNNWYEDDNTITVEQYESTIDPTWRKYYEPRFTPSNTIYQYRRKREDWIVNTNQILRYTTLSNSASFSTGEIVDIKFPNTEITGGGTVVASNSTTLTIHHVSGNTFANGSVLKTIVGETSGANVTANGVTVLAENFTNAEAVFWSSVSFFDLELEKYEARKSVNVISNDLIFEVAEEVRDTLNVASNNFTF